MLERYTVCLQEAKKINRLAEFWEGERGGKPGMEDMPVKHTGSLQHCRVANGLGAQPDLSGAMCLLKSCDGRTGGVRAS